MLCQAAGDVIGHPDVEDSGGTGEDVHVVDAHRPKLMGHSANMRPFATLRVTFSRVVTLRTRASEGMSP